MLSLVSPSGSEVKNRKNWFSITEAEKKSNNEFIIKESTTYYRKVSKVNNGEECSNFAENLVDAFIIMTSIDCRIRRGKGIPKTLHSSMHLITNQHAV